MSEDRSGRSRSRSQTLFTALTGAFGDRAPAAWRCWPRARTAAGASSRASYTDGPASPPRSSSGCARRASGGSWPSGRYLRHSCSTSSATTSTTGYLKLGDSFHTQGFYQRESSLVPPAGARRAGGRSTRGHVSRRRDRRGRTCGRSLGSILLPRNVAAVLQVGGDGPPRSRDESMTRLGEIAVPMVTRVLRHAALRAGRERILSIAPQPGRRRSSSRDASGAPIARAARGGAAGAAAPGQSCSGLPVHRGRVLAASPVTATLSPAQARERPSGARLAELAWMRRAGRAASSSGFHVGLVGVHHWLAPARIRDHCHRGRPGSASAGAAAPPGRASRARTPHPLVDPGLAPGSRSRCALSSPPGRCGGRDRHDHGHRGLGP